MDDGKAKLMEEMRNALREVGRVPVSVRMRDVSALAHIPWAQGLASPLSGLRVVADPKLPEGVIEVLDQREQVMRRFYYGVDITIRALD
jgi:hypothetical protein